MFTISIHGDTAEEVRHNLLALAGVLDGQPPTQESTESQTSAQTQTEEPAPTPLQTPTLTSKNTVSPRVTMEEVRAKLAELMQAGKRDQVRALFGRVHPGAEKLSDVPDEKLRDLLIAAEAIS